MKVKYEGVYPQVRYKGKVYSKGEWIDVDVEYEFPNDFMIEGMKKKDEFEKLKKIKGIGKKTIQDLREIYDNDFNRLVKDCKTMEIRKVPIRDDIAEILIKEYGD